jgi:hypothetical protein
LIHEKTKFAAIDCDAAASALRRFGFIESNEGCAGSRKENEPARAAIRSIMAWSRELGEVEAGCGRQFDPGALAVRILPN